MTREVREELERLLPAGSVRFDEPMGRYSTMAVGGPAEVFVVVPDIEGLKKLLPWASERNVDYLFWGGGSNTLVRDAGIRGAVVKLGTGFDFIDVNSDRTSGDEFYVSVGAATPTQKLLAWCAEQGASGLEGLAGVQGTVGGNLLTNAGTEGGTVGESVEEITIVTKEGKELTLRGSSLNFDYRRLKLPRTAALTRVLFRLTKREGTQVAARMEELLKKRADVQPEGVASLGCVFKNQGKTPAGILIEDAGLKGIRVGGARVSTVHANFIVNETDATARDVTVLISLIRDRVKEQTDTVLETEILIVGDK